MWLFLLADPSWVSELFARSNYLAPFTVLLLCGLGLPLPEEVTLIGSGILVHQGSVNFWLITAVCSAAILLGDSIPFWLGRHYGMSALRMKWVARILHPDRLAKIERRFAEHGNWAVFTCRFLPGVRLPGYFTAGTLGMPYARMITLDALGVALSVPVSIYLGELFGGSVENLQRQFTDLHLVLAFLVVCLVSVMVLRARTRRRQPDSKAADEAPGDGEAPSEERSDEVPDPPAPLKDPSQVRRDGIRSTGSGQTSR